MPEDKEYQLTDVMPIPDCPHYYTTPDGNVYFVKQLVAQQNKDNKYWYVKFTIKGRRIKHYIHRLVAATFIAKRRLKTSEQVDHKFKDKANNHHKDLEIVTNAVNSHRKYYGYSDYQTDITKPTETF